MTDLSEILTPVSECSTQPYSSNKIQLFNIIEWLLAQTGPADIAISTFSTSEEFLRRFFRLKLKGSVRNCTLYADLRAAKKTLRIKGMIKQVFSQIRLCMNHSKVVLIANNDYRVAIITSQNQTRGDRYEAGIITTDPVTFNKLREGFDALSQNSISIDDI